MSTQKPKPKPYTFLNQSRYPFLTQLSHLRQAKQNPANEPNFEKFLFKSNPLFVKWFNWTKPQYILVEIDDKQRTINFYEKHPLIQTKTQFAQNKVKASLVFHQFRSFNQNISLQLKKNFINGAISPSFTYNWITHNEKDPQNLPNRKTQFGVKFDFGKWLNNSTITNEKKIFVSVRDKCKIQSLPIDNYEAILFLANRSNQHRLKDKKAVNTDSIVKRSSDIIGYRFSTHYEKIGLQWGLEGGYDYFHGYNFNRLGAIFGNFKEYEKHVVEMIVRGGTVFGKDIMENDLLIRNKGRWVEDRSRTFLSTRLNFIFKNFHPIFGGVFQIVPLFYLQGCVSKNTTQMMAKYQLDYGLGLRFLNLPITLDTSLIRIGKNLDDMNPSIRIVF